MCNFAFYINFAIFSIFLSEKFGDSEKGRIFALAFGNEASRQGQRLVKEAKLRKSSLKDLHRRRSTGAVSWLTLTHG